MAECDGTRSTAATFSSIVFSVCCTCYWALWLALALCLVQVRRLTEENEELCKEREAAVCSLEEEVQRCRSVEGHFETLRSNHQQMIEIKDQYKQEASALRARLEALSSGRQLEAERAAELTRHESEVTELRGELEQARCSMASAEDRSR